MFEKARRQRRPVRTRDKILQALKERGPADSQTLAARLGLSAMAIRHHLCALRRERLVAHSTARRPYGRPAKLYHLSEAANLLFPNHHTDLAIDMFTALRTVFGKTGLDRVIATWGRRELASIKSLLPKKGGIEQRLEALARARDDQGYFASIRTADADTWLLIENHCPIQGAASACSSLCQEELAIFRKVLGPRHHVERIKHQLSGDRNCVYSIGTKEK